MKPSVGLYRSSLMTRAYPAHTGPASAIVAVTFLMGPAHCVRYRRRRYGFGLFPMSRELPCWQPAITCTWSLGRHARPLADHEPGQRDEAGCGEQFLAQVVLDGVPDRFLGA